MKVAMIYIYDKGKVFLYVESSPENDFFFSRLRKLNNFFKVNNIKVGFCMQRCFNKVLIDDN